MYCLLMMQCMLAACLLRCPRRWLAPLVSPLLLPSCSIDGSTVELPLPVLAQARTDAEGF